MAKLYECKNGTKVINQAVKRNIKRFPTRYYFQLTKKEYQEILRSQNVSLGLEQGVAMFSSALRTSVAEEVSIKIMDAFITMRHYCRK